MCILIKEVLIVFVFLFTWLSIKANILVTLWTASANVVIKHFDVLVQFCKDDFVNLLHQEDANSLHILVGEELIIVVVNNRKDLLSKEVKALAQASTQAVLLDPLIFAVVYVFDWVEFLLFTPGLVECVKRFAL